MKDAKPTQDPARARVHRDLSSPQHLANADEPVAVSASLPPAPSPDPTRTAAADANTERSIAELLQVMTALRDPVTGCPWDKEQTFASIAPYTIEEAYEVADAIERQDMAALKEELGDLLLQVVYHAQIAHEQDAFAFADVVDAIASKMIRRHPHVFGSGEERAKGASDGFWERAKARERAAKARRTGDGDPLHVPEDSKVAATAGAAASVATPSVLDDVPLPLPALTRAVKLQNKAARVGFDWPSLTPVFDKMREELAELEEVIAGDDAKRIEEEYGDLLFVIANVARHLKMDPEKALRGTNAKFTRRFQRIETLLAERGKTPEQSDLQEMDGLWDEAKREERGER